MFVSDTLSIHLDPTIACCKPVMCIVRTDCNLGPHQAAASGGNYANAKENLHELLDTQEYSKSNKFVNSAHLKFLSVLTAPIPNVL